MSSRFWEEPPRWAERCRDWAWFLWLAAVAAWRRNPGYAVAAMSGSLGLLLAIWLLLSAFFSWLIAPNPSQALSDGRSQETEPGSPPIHSPDPSPIDDSEGSEGTCEVRIRPTKIRQTVVHSRRIFGIPLEPEFADTMPAPVEPPGRLVPAVVDHEVDDEPIEEEPTIVSRFTRANPDFDSRFEDDEPLPPIEDDDPPMIADGSEPAAETELRLLHDPLTPEFADSRALAWLMPEPEMEPPAEEPAASPEPAIARSEDRSESKSEGWKGAAPLTPVPTHSQQSEHAATRVVPPESPVEVTEKPVSEPPSIRSREPKLQLRWGPRDMAQAGRIHTMTLFVSNVGDAPAVDVQLELRLPGGVGHPEGRNLEQMVERLGPGDVVQIPLIIRPETAGEVRIPVSARSGKVSARATGVLRVDDAPRGALADRSCETGVDQP